MSRLMGHKKGCKNGQKLVTHNGQFVRIKCKREKISGLIFTKIYENNISDTIRMLTSPIETAL